MKTFPYSPQLYKYICHLKWQKCPHSETNPSFLRGENFLVNSFYFFKIYKNTRLKTYNFIHLNLEIWIFLFHF